MVHSLTEEAGTPWIFKKLERAKAKLKMRFAILNDEDLTYVDGQRESMYVNKA